MSVPYSALLIADDVQTHSQEAFNFDLAESATLAVVESLIQEVTGMLEGAIGLNRNLITRQYSHYFQYVDWEYDPARALYYVPAPQWPVAEIDTASFTSGISRRSFQNEADMILYASPFSGVVVYYAGYRRPEQVLANFTAGGAGEGSLTGLATLPSEIPHDIRNVALNGVMMLLSERRGGPGQRTRVLNPAVQTTTIQETVSDYIRRMVKERIYHHRVLS